MQWVRLNFMSQSRWACLGELSGYEELAITGTDTACAIQLVDGLLVAAPGGALEPGRAGQLTAADRDLLFTAICSKAYGPRIVGTLSCLNCGELFDIGFLLEDLAAHVWENGRGAESGQDRPVERLTDGLFAMPDGTRFRLPTGEDECAVAALPPDQARQALMARCLENGKQAVDIEGERGDAIEDAMARLAPILNLELDAACSECGRIQPVRFDIQHYLLSSLLQEQDQLALEIHRLAGAYGWGLDEILRLPRRRRRRLATLILAERSTIRRELT